MSLRELWARIWPLVLILAVTIGGWYLLSNLSLQARTHDPNISDYDKAKEWATNLLGLAGTFAGFLGIAAASQRLGLSSEDRAESAEGGIVGVLAGATLLDVGGWPVPIALALWVTGLAAVRVVRTLRK